VNIWEDFEHFESGDASAFSTYLQERREKAEADIEEALEQIVEARLQLEAINDAEIEIGVLEKGAYVINEDDFVAYTQEVAEDIGSVDRNAHWVEIDWDATADNLRADYSTIEIDGVTYYYR